MLELRHAVFLDRQLRVIAAQERSEILELGIVSTHVHTLIHVHPAILIPRLAQRFKGTTSHGLRVAAVGPPLRWAKGYSVQSVSEGALPAVARYVRTQAEHHPLERILGWPPSG
jgi:REP element-mobilizing transposase RayT